MRDLLFDGKHEITADEVLEKMNYYISISQKGMEIHKKEPRACLDLAKGLRNELEKEYKNNSLKRIDDFYQRNKLFYSYRPAIHEATASITGRLTHKNAFNFLYNVEYYMRYYMTNITD